MSGTNTLAEKVMRRPSGDLLADDGVVLDAPVAGQTVPARQVLAVEQRRETVPVCSDAVRRRVVGILPAIRGRDALDTSNALRRHYKPGVSK